VIEIPLSAPYIEVIQFVQVLPLMFWAATGYPLVLGTWKVFSPNTLAGASFGRSIHFPSTSYRFYPGCDSLTNALTPRWSLTKRECTTTPRWSLTYENTPWSPDQSDHQTQQNYSTIIFWTSIT